MKDNKLIIFDTTLRDGEQSPGASMDIDEIFQTTSCSHRSGIDRSVEGQHCRGS